MRTKRMAGLQLGLALCCLVVLSVTPAWAEREVSKTGKASASGMVMIENIAGSIVVEGWNREEISVEGTLGDKVEELIFKTGGKKSKIKVEYPRRVKNINEGAHLVIKVPRGSSLEIECVSAWIEVDGVAGVVEAASVSGDVTIDGPCESVDAESISGRVIVSGTAESIEAESISGDVEVRGEVATIEVATVSGDIDLVFDAYRKLSVESVSGNADVVGGFEGSGPFRFDMHSGDLELIVPKNVSAEFEISSFSGDIDNDFGFKAHRTSKYAPGSELEFTVKDGEARVRINTFSGDVNISKK